MTLRNSINMHVGIVLPRHAHEHYVMAPVTRLRQKWELRIPDISFTSWLWLGRLCKHYIRTLVFVSQNMLTDTDIRCDLMGVERWRTISVTHIEVVKSSLIQCPFARLPLHKGIILPWSVSITPAGFQNADTEKGKDNGENRCYNSWCDTQTGISTSYCWRFYRGYL